MADEEIEGLDVDNLELLNRTPRTRDINRNEYVPEREVLIDKRILNTPRLSMENIASYNEQEKGPFGGGLGVPDTEGTFRGVTFSRSQSLPHLSTEKLPHRARSLSTRYSRHTLHRMRNISQRHFSTIGPQDENQERGNWDNPIEFFLSILGYAVGLGNIWRFPYLCYRNGGGAFLIPYLIMLAFCGFPLMFMELSLGQYASEGPLSIWKMSPIFKGTGISMVIVSAMVAMYYNLITGWGLYYLFLSIRETLPWSCCDPSWATENCFAASTCGEDDTVFNNQSNASLAKWGGNNSNLKMAADEYFHNHILGISEGLHDMGSVQWPVFLSLLIAWILVFLVLMKGIKSLSKTVYFTSTFPYLVLLILLIRSAIEPGAVDGIRFYLTPKWEVLLQASVWGDAASQIFYSTGVCFGGTITLASYNKFRNNLYRDAVVVALGNSATSVFSGFVVFSILGFMARNMNTTVEAVATSGPGLTFVAYPQAVTMLPVSPLWNFMFFLMLVTLALSTMFPTTENIATSLIDQFPALRAYTFFVTFAVCLGLFIPGIALTASGGMYVLQLMDTYAVGYSLLIIGLFEVVVVSWRYGADRLLDNIQAMIGFRPCVGFKYIWKFVTPSLLLFSIIFTLINLKAVTYGTYVFPDWAGVIGWMLTGLVLMPIPLYAAYSLTGYMIKNKGGSIWQALYHLSSPTEAWGPALQKYRFAGAETGEDEVFS